MRRSIGNERADAAIQRLKASLTIRRSRGHRRRSYDGGKMNGLTPAVVPRDGGLRLQRVLVTERGAIVSYLPERASVRVHSHPAAITSSRPAPKTPLPLLMPLSSPAFCWQLVIKIN